MSTPPDSVLDSILAAAEALTVSVPAPAPPRGDSSPLMRRIARKGGYDEGTVPGKLFSVIDIDYLDYFYCFGVIGNGSAFCTRRNCPVKTHASVKVTFCGKSESFVFIRRIIPGTVFCEPKLASVKIPPEVMTDWESRSLTISDWVLEFQAIDGTYDTSTSVEESQIEKEFILDSSLMRTPAKRKRILLAVRNTRACVPLGRIRSSTGFFQMIRKPWNRSSTRESRRG